MNLIFVRYLVEQFRTYRKRNYQQNRTAILASNLRCKLRRGHLWKNTQRRLRRQEYQPRTAVCVDCGLEVFVSNATSYPRSNRYGRKFIRCNDCEQETHELNPRQLAETIKKRPFRDWPRFLRRRHLFLYDENLESQAEDLGYMVDPHLQTYLQEVLLALPARERLVLNGRFVDQFTLEEIGDRLGLTRERIRQIANKALERCRKKFALLEFFEVDG